MSILLHDARNIMSGLIRGNDALKEMDREIKITVSVIKFAAEHCASRSLLGERNFDTGKFVWGVITQKTGNLWRHDIDLRCFSNREKANILFSPSFENTALGKEYSLRQDAVIIQELYQDLPNFIIGMNNLFPRILEKLEPIIAAGKITRI